MDLIKEIAHLFLLSLGLGTAFFSFILPEKAGPGLAKLILSVSFGCLLLAFLAMWPTNWSQFHFLHLSVLLNISLLYFSYKETRNRRVWFLEWFKILLSTTLILLLASTSWKSSFYIFSATMLLGTINFCMLFGHYYLVVPKLEEKYLLLATNMFIAAYTLKIISMISSGTETVTFLQQATNTMDSFFNSIILGLRILWGPLVLGILGYFSWRLVKMRSIQSATGVFYVMVFSSFIAELISFYLFFKHGLYL